MPPGPKPIPIGIKRAAGNPGKQKLRHEPPAVKVRPEMPDFLDVQGKKCWARTIEKLERAGILTELDGETLGAYSAAYSDFVRLRKRIRARKHRLVNRTKTGYESVDALWPLLKARENELRKWGELLGMSPVSRTRLATEAPDDGDESDLDAV